MGGTKVWDKERCAFVFDHYAPTPDVKSAANHKEMREFAQKNELRFHFDTNCGVCHQVMPEAGVIYPGMIVVATDSHTTTHGAFGAMGTGCGATDMATILMTGELWFRVPEIIEVRLEGEAPKGVYPKDVVLAVLGKIRADGAVYKAIDFTGSYVENLNVAGRMVICNMAVEMGAKTAYMQPNQDVIDYASQRAVRSYEIQYTDPGYEYAERYVFDVSSMEPELACPSSVENVHTLASVVAKGLVKLNQGYIGSCTGGREEDIAVAAKILKGRHIPEYTRLIIVPASREVMLECMKKGYIQELMDAGATITTPGCGACLGAHEGILAPGEICITSTNRNFPGRMGSTEAQIYLASPATVAASMVNGYITDPDQIYPGCYLALTDTKEIGSHCLSGVDKNIAPNFPQGGMVVAGRNFGCGSSREHAPIALLNMGTSVVIADSFARIFFRNAVNLGLVPVICKGIRQNVKSGQTLTVDIKNGTVKVEETGEIFACEQLGEQAFKILEAGGIKPMMRARFGKAEK